MEHSQLAALWQGLLWQSLVVVCLSSVYKDSSSTSWVAPQRTLASGRSWRQDKASRQMRRALVVINKRGCYKWSGRVRKTEIAPRPVWCNKCHKGKRGIKGKVFAAFYLLLIEFVWNLLFSVELDVLLAALVAWTLCECKGTKLGILKS